MPEGTAERRRGGFQRQETCKQGHPWVDATTSVNKKGHRLCRICRRAHMAKVRARQRASKPPRPTWQERFWSHVAPDRVTGCWIWTSTINTKRGGYGQFADAERRNRRAHRVAYELAVGPIPEGLALDHLCRTPACVNPDHLEPVTALVNNRRGRSNPMLTAQTQICQRGHKLTPENTYVQPSNGARNCRLCKKHADARRHAKNRMRR